MGLRTFLGLKRPTPSIDRFAASADQLSDEERTKTDIHRIVYGNIGPASHKWHHYLDIYDRHLARFRGSDVRLLEIGVQNGGSLKMWREYLGPRATIYGIDIDPACAALDGLHGQVRVGSQSDEAFLAKVVSEMGGLDVVIDDGSHIATDQCMSFKFLFPRLAQRGLYLCEDTHTSYWPSHQGGWRKGGTFIEFTKSLIDDMHVDFSESVAFNEEIARAIGGLHVYNSMIVFEKAVPLRPMNILVGTPRA